MSRELIIERSPFGLRAGLLQDGRLVEEGPTGAVFDSPREGETRDYLAGVFG